MEANNMAAMRAALENSNELLREVAKTGEWNDIANAQIADNKAALEAPARECDAFKSELRADDLHAAFVKYCDGCDCPMGCIHRRLPAGQDAANLPILNCFARFVLSKKSKEGDE